MSGLAAFRQFTRLEWGDYPFTAGRLLYLLKGKFGDGLRVTWYRDVVRPRIVSLPPVTTDDARCEIHVLTSAGDWLNLCWALRSFYQFSGRRYALCIHDDGTLDADSRAALRRSFPTVRLISREEADRRLEPLLQPFPRCARLRGENTLALKVLDFPAFLEAERMMILDSDVLFFAEPTALIHILETSPENSLNQDWQYGYTVDLEAVRLLLDFDLPPRINSGLGLIHRASLSYEWMEEFLALPDILSHRHKIEQTLFALCSARFGYHMLPEPYDVRMGADDESLPCRHYSGPIRPLMYSEGIKRLAGFLNAP